MKTRHFLLLLVAFLLVAPSVSFGKSVPRNCTKARYYAKLVKRIRVPYKRSLENFNKYYKEYKILNSRARLAQLKVIIYFHKIFGGSKKPSRNTWRFYQRKFRSLKIKLAMYKKLGIPYSSIQSSGYKLTNLVSGSSKYGSKFRKGKFNIKSSWKSSFASNSLKQIYQAYLLRQYKSAVAQARTLSRAAAAKGRQAYNAGKYAWMWRSKFKRYVSALRRYNTACIRDLLRKKKFFKIIRWKKAGLDLNTASKRCGGFDDDAALLDDCVQGACTSTVDMSDSEQEGSLGGDALDFGNSIGFEGNFQTLGPEVESHESFDSAAGDAETTFSTF